MATPAARRGNQAGRRMQRLASAVGLLLYQCFWYFLFMILTYLVVLFFYIVFLAYESVQFIWVLDFFHLICLRPLQT